MVRKKSRNAEKMNRGCNRGSKCSVNSDSSRDLAFLCEACGKKADYAAQISENILIVKLSAHDTCAFAGCCVLLCGSCALELYKKLGEQFVPKSIPNIILRTKKNNAAGSKCLHIANLSE